MKETNYTEYHHTVYPNCVRNIEYDNFDFPRIVGAIHDTLSYYNDLLHSTLIELGIQMANYNVEFTYLIFINNNSKIYQSSINLDSFDNLVDNVNYAVSQYLSMKTKYCSVKEFNGRRKDSRKTWGAERSIENMEKALYFMRADKKWLSMGKHEAEQFGPIETIKKRSSKSTDDKSIEK